MKDLKWYGGDGFSYYFYVKNQSIRIAFHQNIWLIDRVKETEAFGNPKPPNIASSEKRALFRKIFCADRRGFIQ